MIIIKNVVIKWLIKFGWPVIKYVIVNFGQQIANYVSNEIKERVRKNKAQKMEDAFNRAKQNEESARNAIQPEDRLRFYEIAKEYQEQGEFYRKALYEFEKEIDSVISAVVNDAVEKSNQLEFDHLFEIENKELKAADKTQLLEGNPKSKLKKS